MYPWHGEIRGEARITPNTKVSGRDRGPSRNPARKSKLSLQTDPQLYMYICIYIYWVSFKTTTPQTLAWTGLRRCNFSSFVVVGLLFSEGWMALEVLGLKSLESSRPCGSVIFLLHGFSLRGVDVVLR